MGHPEITHFAGAVQQVLDNASTPLHSGSCASLLLWLRNVLFHDDKTVHAFDCVCGWWVNLFESTLLYIYVSWPICEFVLLYVPLIAPGGWIKQFELNWTGLNIFAWIHAPLKNVQNRNRISQPRARFSFASIWEVIAWFINTSK